MSISLKSAALTLLLFLSIAGPRICHGQAASEPTPYPTRDQDWPGKGIIRKFGWMDDNRKSFWSQRSKAHGSVVFCGDSLTGGWTDVAKAFPALKVANRGIGGDTSRGLLFRFKEDVLDLQPKAIVILIGTNDLTALGSPMDAVSNISDMLNMVEQQDATLPVVLCTTPPSANPKAPVKAADRATLNAEIIKLAEAHKNVSLCDLYAVTSKEDGSPKLEYFNPDKLHLAAAGHAKWAELINPIFEKLKLKN
jgi:lysophospholipase L1-like esterase